VPALSFDFLLSHADGLGDPVIMTHEPTPADEPYAYEALATMQVPRVASVHTTDVPVQSCASVSPVTVLTPPPIEGEMNANHGSVFETIGFLTGLVLIGLGTAFYFLSQKLAAFSVTAVSAVLVTAVSTVLVTAASAPGGGVDLPQYFALVVHSPRKG
jgi:hypothetical protein